MSKPRPKPKPRTAPPPGPAAPSSSRSKSVESHASSSRLQSQTPSREFFRSPAVTLHNEPIEISDSEDERPTLRRDETYWAEKVREEQEADAFFMKGDKWNDGRKRQIDVEALAKEEEEERAKEARKAEEGAHNLQLKQAEAERKRRQRTGEDLNSDEVDNNIGPAASGSNNDVTVPEIDSSEDQDVPSSPTTPRRALKRKRGRLSGYRERAKALPEWTREDPADLKKRNEAEVIEVLSLSSGSDTEEEKLDVRKQKGRKTARERRHKSRSLTPPPGADPQILRNAENLVRTQLAASRADRPRHHFDDNDEAFNFEPDPGAIEQLNPELLAIRESLRNKKLDLRPATVVDPDLHRDLSVGRSKSRSPMPPGGDQLEEDKITVHITFKWPNEDTPAMARAKARYEKPTKYKLGRRETFDYVLNALAVNKNLSPDIIILTRSENMNRIYQSMTPAALNVISEIHFTAWRKDRYKEEAERQGVQRRNNFQDPSNDVASRSDAAARGEASDDDFEVLGASSIKSTIISRTSPTRSLSPVEPTVSIPRFLPAVDPLGANGESAAENEPKVPPIKITMKSLTGDIRAMLKSTSKVSALLRHFSNKSGIPLADLSAQMDGETLNPTMTLEDAEMEDGDTVDIVVRSR